MYVYVHVHVCICVFIYICDSCCSKSLGGDGVTYPVNNACVDPTPARFNSPLRPRPWRGQSTRSLDCCLRRRLGRRVVFVVEFLVLVLPAFRLCFCARVVCVFCLCLASFGVIFPSTRSMPNCLLIPQIFFLHLASVHRTTIYTMVYTTHPLPRPPVYAKQRFSKPRFAPNHDLHHTLWGSTPLTWLQVFVYIDFQTLLAFVTNPRLKWLPLCQSQCSLHARMYACMDVFFS